MDFIVAQQTAENLKFTYPGDTFIALPHLSRGWIQGWKILDSPNSKVYIKYHIYE